MPPIKMTNEAIRALRRNAQVVMSAGDAWISASSGENWVASR